MGVMALVPVLFAVIIVLLNPLISEEGIRVSSLFPQVSVFLYIHFLLPLTAIFVGTAVIGGEVDGRTLPYLLTRPIPRKSIVISKLLSGTAVTGVLFIISVALTYIILKQENGFSGLLKDIDIYLGTIGILFLGLVVYLPLFCLTGGILKRPVLLGLFFTFGWESTVSFLPGNIKYFSISHYLHILAKRLYNNQFTTSDPKQALLNILFHSKEISSAAAIAILLTAACILIVLSATLLYIKEYRLEKG
jgi:ABC-type transport system involved in multi-copper enzyme maturation permease subunit